jgi:hypothetical protein
MSNKIFKLKPQVNKLSSNVQSSEGAVSFASNINMTVKKTDYNTAINKLNMNVLSRMLIQSRNYKKNISNSTLDIQDTNKVVETTVDIVQATVDTVQATVETVQNSSSVINAADADGEFYLEPWPVDPDVE